MRYPNGFGSVYKLSGKRRKPWVACKTKGWDDNGNQLFKYAMEHDIVSKDYSQLVDIGKNESESTRKPFTLLEIQALWDNVGRMDFIDTVLIMIYTRLRPGELLLIKNANININERIMKGGIKTESGKDRIIPINLKILPFIKNRISEENEFLVVNYEGKQVRYWNYYEEKRKK